MHHCITSAKRRTSWGLSCITVISACLSASHGRGSSTLLSQPSQGQYPCLQLQRNQVLAHTTDEGFHFSQGGPSSFSLARNASFSWTLAATNSASICQTDFPLHFTSSQHSPSKPPMLFCVFLSSVAAQDGQGDAAGVENHCRKCIGADFQAIPNCRVTGWIIDFWNLTNKPCNNHGQLIDAAGLKLLAWFVVMCAVFTATAWYRRKQLLAQVRF